MTNRDREMKTKSVMMIALTALLLAGCRPGRLATERLNMVRDSTAVWVQRDSLALQTAETIALRSDLRRLRGENTRRWNEGLHHVIKYDRGAPIDSATGKPPVLSEWFSLLRSGQENSVQLEEWRQQEWSRERESLLRANSSLRLSVEELTRMNRELKEQTVSPTRFSLRSLLSGIFAAFCVGCFTGILLMLRLPHRR
jgi:hypothetical protein